METKHEMPALTDEQRQELIAEIDYNRKNCFLSSKTELLMQVAEAALMAPPVASVLEHQDIELNWQGRELKAGHELYAAPPFPALKLPDDIDWNAAHALLNINECGEDRIEAFRMGANWRLSEIKSLNGVSK